MIHQPARDLFSAVQDQLPKALIGLIIPATQFAWKAWQGRRVESRKKKLREKVKDLSQFRSIQFDNTPEALASRQDAETELTSAIKELATLTAGQVEGGPTRVVRNWAQEWFLFYTPTGVAWIPHIFYFIMLALTLWSAIAVAQDIHAPDVGDGLAAVVFYTVLSLVCRKWASYAKRGFGSDRSNRKRLRKWTPVAGIVIAVMFECLMLAGMAMDGQEDIRLTTLWQNIKDHPMVFVIVNLMFGPVAWISWYWWRNQAR